MRGMPKWCNTVEDVLHSMEEDREGTRARLKQMLEARMVWFPAGETEAPGLTGEGLKVVPVEDETTGETRLMQYELREDPNAWMFRIGLTVETINELLED